MDYSVFKTVEKVNKRFLINRSIKLQRLTFKKTPTFWKITATLKYF